MTEHDSPRQHRAVTTTLARLWGAYVEVAQSEGNPNFAEALIESEGAAVILLDTPDMIRAVLTRLLAELNLRYPPG